MTIRNELADQTDRVRVEIRDADDESTNDAREFSRSEWASGQFSFGIQQGRQGAFVVAATAYKAAEIVVQAKARFTFTSKHKTQETLWLRRACQGVGCTDGKTCDSRTMACGAIPGSSGTGPVETASAGMSGAAGAPIDGSAGRDARDADSGAADSGSVIAGSGGNQAAGSGGMTGHAGSSVAGASGGTAGVSPATGGPVSGTLIDFYRHPVASVEVRIGDQVSQTDDLGRFHFADVGPSYDISYVIPAASANGTVVQTQFWLYEDLTRRDPVLQCYVYPTVLRTTNIHFVLPALASNQGAHVAFGNAEGPGQWWLTVADKQDSISWWGPMNSAGTFHALLASYDSSSGMYTYPAYEEQAHVLGPSQADITFTFPASSVQTYSVSGHVAAPGLRKRQNQMWVRWDDGAALYLAAANDTGDQIAFSIPALPSARGALMAIEGTLDSSGYIVPPYGAAFVDDLTTPTSEVQLSIPKPPLPVGPADAAEGVNAGTMFQWSETAGVNIMNILSDTGLLFVVTKRSETLIPARAFDVPFSLPLNAALTWNVGVYGGFTDVDAATSSGFLGGVSYLLDFRGPVHGAGSIAWSETRKFTTAP